MYLHRQLGAPPFKDSKESVVLLSLQQAHLWTWESPHPDSRCFSCFECPALELLKSPVERDAKYRSQLHIWYVAGIYGLPDRQPRREGPTVLHGQALENLLGFVLYSLIWEVFLMFLVCRVYLEECLGLTIAFGILALQTHPI